jgi:5-methylcytosine-specific restriction endonuclease McrA
MRWLSVHSGFHSSNLMKSIEVKMRKVTCQLCEKVYTRADSKINLCPDCATETMVREARILRASLSLAQTYDLPATLTLPQWITTLDYFDWTCAYCLKQPYELMEHFIPVSMRHSYHPYATIIGGTTIKNCVPACYDCNGLKRNNRPDYIWKASNGVEQGMFPTLEMIERIAQYLQIDLNNLPLSLCVNKKSVLA